MSTLEVVVGGQFGSEAKGHITQRLTEQAQRKGILPQVLRVAGPNAGHTGYDVRGRAWALRQVPVAAVTEGNAVLGITAGSEVDPAVLFDEIDRLTDAGLMRNKALWVSGEATIIELDHIKQESKNEQDLQRKIGSTAKGIGAARAARIWRNAMRVSDSDWLCDELQSRGVMIAPPQLVPSNSYSHTIVEGTQGYGLGLHAGYYPKCTSSDCRAQDFVAMAGVPSWIFDEVKVYVVARVYPIRVAGNSGPLIDETSWEELGLPEEYTTVTKKVRRVGKSDWDLVHEAVRANGGPPTVRVALTMLDQKFPELQGVALDDIPFTGSNIQTYLKDVQRAVGAKIEWVTTGPNTATNIAYLEI